MSNRFLKWVSVLSAVSLVSGAVFVLTATAHIGASHSPLTTDAPDLRTATIDGDDAVVCYDENLDEDNLPGDTDYAVRGYNDAIIETSDDVELDDDESCVRAAFDAQDMELELFTILHSAEGLVEDSAGNSSVEAAAELDGSAPDSGSGHNTAPNLTEFDVDGTNDTITYTFAGDVDCDILDDNSAADSENFGFHDDDGNFETGGDIVDCDGNEVEVGSFTGDVEDAERAVIDNDEADDASSGAGADGGGGDICTEETEGGDQDCAGFEHEGRTTSDPDLTDAERVGNNEWEGTFDQQLDDSVNDDSEIHLAAEDGELYEPDGGSCETREGDEVVRCEWSDLEDVSDDEIVAMQVGDCAVLDDDTGDCNTVGDAALSASPESGLTDSVDLEALDIDEGDNTGTFTFDDNVDEDTVDSDGDEFSLVDDQGNLAGGDDVIDVINNEVVIEFNESDIDDAVGGHVSHNDVGDFFEGPGPNTNTGTSVGAQGAQPSPTTSPTSPTTTTTTTTTTTSPGPRTRRVATTLTIRFNRRARAFKGSVGSSRKRCQTQRLVTLLKKRRGRPGFRAVGSDTSNRSGNWSIRKRRARGRYKARVARKVFTARNGDTIICLKDTSPTIRVRRRRR